MTLSFGDFRDRAAAIERLDSHDAPDDELNALFDFWDKVARYFGGYSPVLSFLSIAARRWTGPITVLDIGCGRGGLARAVVDWSRSRGLDVKVHGADKYGRVVHLARERHKGIRDLTFETRDLKDPFYLQAQQFDYVVSAQALHRENDERATLLLKTANRMAKRGVIAVDWLRDARAAFYLGTLARFSRLGEMRDESRLAVRRGFSTREAEALRESAGLDYAKTRIHFGYRFSIAGERGLQLDPTLAPTAELAGA